MCSVESAELTHNNATSPLEPLCSDSFTRWDAYTKGRLEQGFNKKKASTKSPELVELFFVGIF